MQQLPLSWALASSRHAIPHAATLQHAIAVQIETAFARLAKRQAGLRLRTDVIFDTATRQRARVVSIGRVHARQRAAIAQFIRSPHPI